MARIADYTDEELAGALHFLDAHDGDLDYSERRAWTMIKELIIGRAQAHREVEADNSL